METVFLSSYVFLAALLGWESFAVFSILKRSARLRAEQWGRQKAADSRLARIPFFQGTLIGLDDCVQDSDLKGEQTALLFVDTSDESDASRLTINALLRRAHDARHLCVFLGSRHDEALLELKAFLALIEHLSFASVKLVYDRNSGIAGDFGIDTFPTLVLADHDGKVERIWRNLRVYFQPKRQEANSSAAGPSVTRVSGLESG